MAVSHGMLDPGNVIVSAPYYIAGKASVTLPTAGGRLATLVNFGRIDVNGGQGAALIPVPIRITRAYLMLAVISGAGSTAAVEIVKGTATTKNTVDGTHTERVCVARKTTGYPAIANTEVSLIMTTDGTVVAGGNFAQVGEPLVYAFAGSAATFGAGDGIWVPADMVPLTLEAGEAAAVQVTAQGAATVGVLGVCFDFLRQ